MKDHMAISITQESKGQKVSCYLNFDIIYYTKSLVFLTILILQNVTSKFSFSF
jgi:hypothetical protein